MAVEIQHTATGRRKTSMARVRLVPGSGAITVNKRPLDDYFPNNVLKMVIKQPLASTETAEKFDIHVTVAGGGPSGQAGAIRHGISRALTEYNLGASQEAQEGRLPHPRSADEGAQEVRPARRPGPVPVLASADATLRLFALGLLRFTSYVLRLPSHAQGGVIWHLFR